MGRDNAWTSEVDWHTGRWQTRRPAPAPRPWQPPLPRGTLPKRPLTFLEVLDSGFRLLRFDPGLAVGAPLIVFTLWTLLLTAIGTGLAVAFLPFLRDLGTNEEAMSGFALLAQLGSFVLSFLSLGLAHFLSGLVAVGALRSFHAQRMSLNEAWRALSGRRVRLIVAALLVTAVDVVLLGVLALPAGLLTTVGNPVVAGITGTVAGLVWIGAVVWLNLRLAFLGSAIATEDLPIGTGLRRSWALTGRGFWRTLGQLALGYFLSNQLVQVVISPLVTVVTAVTVVVLATNPDDPAVLAAVGIAAGAIVLGLTAISSAVLFGYFSCLVAVCWFDSRMRSEGFDLVLIRAAEERAA